MNILHVTPYFAPAWAYGGPPRSVFELCRALVRNGHSVTVATTDSCDAERRLTRPAETMDGIRVLRFPNISNHLAWRRQLFLPTGSGRFLRDTIRDFDIVHLHMYRTLQDIVIRRYATRYRVPYVFSARGSLLRIVRQRGAKALFDVAFGYRVLRDASWLIALSQTEKEQYESMGVPPSKITVIFNGIDFDSLRNSPPKGSFAGRYGLEHKRIVTYLGRLNARKGLDYLLRSFQGVRARQDDAVLVLAGPDEGCRARLERLASALRISDSVLFTGLVTGRDRLEVLADSDVVVYPGYHEVFGLVPFEALACGKPVVVSNDSGCGEIVKEVGAGFVVPFGDIRHWEEAMIAVLEDGSEVDEMVRRGREFVRDHLNWQVVAAKVESVYRGVDSSRRGQ